MVKLDLGIKQIISLFQDNSLTLKELENYLNQFEKKDFIDYIKSEYIIQEEEPQEDETPI